MYTIDEIIDYCKIEENQAYRDMSKEMIRTQFKEEFEGIWHTLGIEQFEENFRDGIRYKFDEEDMKFWKYFWNNIFREPVWNKCIKRKACTALVIFQNGREYSVYHDIEKVVRGLICIADKVIENVDERALFAEKLYRETNYRKFHLKKKFEIMIDDLPELSDEILNDSINMVIGEYRMLFEGLECRVEEDFKLELKGWKERKETSNKKIIEKMQEEKLEIRKSGIYHELISNMQLDELINELNHITVEKSCELGQFAEKKSLKEVVYDYYFDETLKSKISYSKLVKNKASVDYQRLINRYSNDTRSWRTILEFCGIKEWLLKENDTWMFSKEDANFVGNLLMTYNRDRRTDDFKELNERNKETWKMIKKHLAGKEEKMTYELYWQYGESIVQELDWMIFGFRNILKKLPEEEYVAAVSSMYHKLRFSELLLLHNVLTYIGFRMKKPGKWIIEESDMTKNGFSEFLEQLKEKIENIYNEE